MACLACAASGARRFKKFPSTPVALARILAARKEHMVAAERAEKPTALSTSRRHSAMAQMMRLQLRDEVSPSAHSAYCAVTYLSPERGGQHGSKPEGRRPRICAGFVHASPAPRERRPHGNMARFRDSTRSRRLTEPPVIAPWACGASHPRRGSRRRPRRPHRQGEGSSPSPLPSPDRSRSAVRPATPR